MDFDGLNTSMGYAAEDVAGRQVTNTVTIDGKGKLARSGSSAATPFSQTDLTKVCCCHVRPHFHQLSPGDVYLPPCPALPCHVVPLSLLLLLSLYRKDKGQIYTFLNAMLNQYDNEDFDLGIKQFLIEQVSSVCQCFLVYCTNG
jgi:hypothetical protein